MDFFFFFEHRCPAYLQEFHEIDNTWPEDPTECLNVFHRERVIWLLKQRLEKEKKEEIDRLLVLFPGLLNGFTLQEIASFTPRPFLRARLTI